MQINQYYITHLWTDQIDKILTQKLQPNEKGAVREDMQYKYIYCIFRIEMQLYKYNYFWFPSWPSVTNKYKLGALPGFMEIPAGSQEDQRHKHFFYLQLYFYLQPGFFSLEKLPFSFGRPLPLLSASLTWLFLWCTRKVAYFPTFAFPPSFDFEKIARQRELQIGDVSLPNLVLVSKLNQMPECWSTTKSSWCKNVKSRVGSNISGRWWLAIVLSGVVAALFVCFLICFCHEGGRRVRPVGGLEAASCPGLSAESPLCPASVWTCLSGCPCPTRRCPAGVAVSDGLSEFLSGHQNYPKIPNKSCSHLSVCSWELSDGLSKKLTSWGWGISMSPPSHNASLLGCQLK